MKRTEGNNNIMFINSGGNLNKHPQPTPLTLPLVSNRRRLERGAHRRCKWQPIFLRHLCETTRRHGVGILRALARLVRRWCRRRICRGWRCLRLVRRCLCRFRRLLCRIRHYLAYDGVKQEIIRWLINTYSTYLYQWLSWYSQEPCW